MAQDAGERALRIPRLRSGGIMTNYFCSSRCAHCAYFCSPDWSPDFIDEQMARRVLKAVREAGCRSVHVGGGEPFLGGEKLLRFIEMCAGAGIQVEYVETNSSWFTTPERAEQTLAALREAGLRTLLVSMSPFHNERIPWRKVQGVLDACRAVGMGVYPWTEEMGRDVQALDPDTTHSMEEYEERFGQGYLRSVPGRYWVSLRGRAIATFRPFAKLMSAEEVAAVGGSSCPELYDTSHFHIDLYGNYVPGICSGLAVQVDDLAGPLEREKYRYLTALMDGGIGRLLELGRAEGYEPTRMFSGKCDLCYDIRRCLVVDRGVRSPDLEPAELYIRME
jgi:hypothetical protein